MGGSLIGSVVGVVILSRRCRRVCLSCPCAPVTWEILFPGRLDRRVLFCYSLYPYVEPHFV